MDSGVLIRRILLHLENVVHVADFVTHSRQLRSIFPLAIHNEFVLVHARGEKFDNGEVLPRPLQRLTSGPIVKRPLNLNMLPSVAPIDDCRKYR